MPAPSVSDNHCGFCNTSVPILGAEVAPRPLHFAVRGEGLAEHKQILAIGIRSDGRQSRLCDHSMRKA